MRTAMVYVLEMSPGCRSGIQILVDIFHLDSIEVTGETGRLLQGQSCRQGFVLGPLLRQHNWEQKQDYKALLWAPRMVQTQGLEGDFLQESCLQMEEQCFEDCSDHANLIFPSSQQTVMPNSPNKTNKIILFMPCSYYFFSFTSWNYREEQSLMLNIVFHIHWVTVEHL